jgi:hypothetical protein
VLFQAACSAWSERTASSTATMSQTQFRLLLISYFQIFMEQTTRPTPTVGEEIFDFLYFISAIYAIPRLFFVKQNIFYQFSKFCLKVLKLS